MDAEEAHQLLKKVQLRCQFLEADKEVEALRAAKYRNIILGTGTPAGKDSSGATQPEASRGLRAVRSTSARPTLPAPSPGPEVLAIARRPSTAPMAFVGRKRHMSTVNPAQAAQISKRARLALNNSMASTSTSEPRVIKLATTDANTPFLTRNMRHAGLASLELTKAENTRAKGTPGIGWTMFCNTFGGGKKLEWPKCLRKAGYEDFLCGDVTAQPFIPFDTGKPGLILRLPAITESSQNDKSNFHVLTTMRQGGTLYYRGKYAMKPLPQFQFEWDKLPPGFQKRWMSRARTPGMRALRARIELRNIQKREPAAAEVEEYLQHRFKDQVTQKEISAAFKSGDEKMIVVGIFCTAYDSQLATIIQRNVEANRDYIDLAR